MSDLSASHSSQLPGIGRVAPSRLAGDGRRDRFHVVGRETKQGRNVSYFVEFGVVFYVEGLDVATDGPWKNGLADVDHTLGGATAGGTKAHDVGVQMAALRTFDGVA